MRILIANDDGIDAPGLARLEQVAARLSDDLWTVAPDGKRTAAGASLTLGRPLTMVRRGERRWSCSGTPADCVTTAMTWLFEKGLFDDGLFSGGRKPDLVLSGINDGRNVAEDLAYSGTLGIAREATFWGIPAIGFSRVKNAEETPDDIDWLAGFVSRIWEQRRDIFLDGHWLSVNLPTRLPAPILQPRIGRDKIGAKAEIVSSEGDTTTLFLPRGRRHLTGEGDENDLIDRGNVCVNRLNWFGQTPLAEDRLEALSA
ncbi:MAG: 5'/3'-nucleotidase SurE [Rhizobiales bacterium]|nr:5'/3'-nucleotidase SurE [Hyphomicrobiales bacterium]OJY07546.1 MAG: 5'/3'-nucleotidase SurE [Rhizobiales bacterium 63-22]